MRFRYTSHAQFPAIKFCVGGGGEIATGGGGGKGKTFLFDIFVSAPLFLLPFAIEIAGRGGGGSLSQQKNNNTTPPPFPNGKYFFCRPAIDVSSSSSLDRGGNTPNCQIAKKRQFSRAAPPKSIHQKKKKKKKCDNKTALLAGRFYVLPYFYPIFLGFFLHFPLGVDLIYCGNHGVYAYASAGGRTKEFPLFSTRKKL